MPTETTPPIPSSEACQILSIDRSTLSRWVASGRIAPLLKAPGLRGPFFFDRDEVERVRQESAA